MDYIYNDGGRGAFGFSGHANDCVCRSIAIATGKDYKEIYDALADGNYHQRKSKRSTGSGVRSARNGIFTSRKWFKDYMKSLGFKWTPTMGIGTGCQVHMKGNELPPGTIIVSLSKHYAAVIDGVLNDTQECTRKGTRCVYGYWMLQK